MTTLRAPVAGILSGRTIGGRWRLGRKFGRSSHADVYEIEGHRELCVKVVMRGGPEASRHEAEVQAALGRRSDHIVPIVDCGITSEHGLDETTYIVMPRATCTLETLVGKVAPRDCVHVVGPSLAGLEVAHEEGAFHRDIKPANIFVYGDSARLADATIRIGDWGRVTATGTDYTYGPSRHGTVAYEPPELLSLQEVGARSDLYMLGATVHVLLTGHLLDELEDGDEANPQRRATRLRGKPVVVDSSCPAEWRDFIVSACQRRRDLRGSLRDLTAMCDALARRYNQPAPTGRQPAPPATAAPPLLNEVSLGHEPPTFDQVTIWGDKSLAGLPQPAEALRPSPAHGTPKQVQSYNLEAEESLPIFRTPVPTSPPTPPEQLGKRDQQRRLRRAAAVAAVLAILGFLAVGRNGIPSERTTGTTTAKDERGEPPTPETTTTTESLPPPGPVEAFLGVWHGDSVGEDGAVPLALVVDQPYAEAADDGVGRFGFGQCRGPLRLVGVNDTSLTVTPVSSDPACHFDGEATLTRSGDTASYDWVSADGTSSRFGTFERSTRITLDDDPGWPTDSNEFGSAFYVFLGACTAGSSPPCSQSGQNPDWTSCSGDFCIAGGGSDVVDVYRGLNWILELPESSPNTAVELLMAGFSEPEVVELLNL